MYYSPHKLQVLREQPLVYNDYGELVEPENPEESEWADVSECRCDNSSHSEITDTNGRLFRPAYHIVAPSKAASLVKCGDKVRALCEDGSERGSGFVKNVKWLNYLDYFEIWI